MTDGKSLPLSKELERVLIICPSWIGDAVMATPVLRAVRAHLPRARITAAVRPGIDDVLRGAPWIDETVRVSMKGPLGPLRVGRTLGRSGPQATLLLPNSFRSALTARLTGAPVRIGYDRDRRGRLLTHRLPVTRGATPEPMVEYYTRLGAFACGVDAIDERLELVVTDDERSAAAELLDGVDGAYAVLNPGANRPAKRWPAERFARVADALHESRGLRVLATGGPAERELIDTVVDAAGVSIINLARRGVELGSLKAIVAGAALLVTNDTGPRHIAAALGTPVVSLFGPTDHRWTTLAGANERLILAEPFLPEELVADRHPDLCEIDRIAVEDVIAAASSLLDASAA